MSSILKVSEATSIALHTMAFLASREEGRYSARELAELLGFSEAHLSKVMQRLSRTGLVSSTRGPRGGFTLGRAPSDITLLEVFEAVEGRMDEVQCLLGEPVCSGSCILGGLVEKVNHQVKEYLGGTRLSDIAAVFNGVGTKSA